MFYSQVESGMLILLNQPTGDASNGCQYSREHLSQIILWFWCFVFGVLMCDGEFSLWDQAHSISFGPSSLVYFRWILRINSSVSMWFISFDSTAVAFNSDPCGINDIIMYRTSCQHTFFTNGAPGGLRQLESRHVTLLCVAILWKNTVFWSLSETLGWAGQTDSLTDYCRDAVCSIPSQFVTYDSPVQWCVQEGGRGVLKCPHWSQSAF